MRPRSPFPLANKCLRAAMAICNCRHSSLVRCGDARSTYRFTSSPTSRSLPALAPGSARTHSAMLACSTSTNPRTGHSPSGPGPRSTITVPQARGVGTITLTWETACGASVAGPTARTARVSSVIVLTSVTTRTVGVRPGVLFPSLRDPGDTRRPRTAAP